MNENLNDLNDKIAQFKAGQAQAAPKNSAADVENRNKGMRAGLELVTSLIAGGLIGWFLDGQLGTGPWCLMGFLFLGICTGFWGVYRITNDMGSAIGFARLHQDEKQGKTPAENDPKDVTED